MLSAPLALWSTAALTLAASPKPTQSLAPVSKPASSAHGLAFAAAKDLDSTTVVNSIHWQTQWRQFLAAAPTFVRSPGRFQSAAERVLTSASRSWLIAPAVLKAMVSFPDVVQTTSPATATDSDSVFPTSAMSQELLTPPDFGAPSETTILAASPTDSERRFSLRDEDGQPIVARLHGHYEGKSVLVLPDGRLGIPSMLIPTEEPFRPMTMDEVAAGLLTEDFSDYAIHRTDHYLILYQPTPPDRPGDSSGEEFAKTNGVLLEDLYNRLVKAFHKHDVATHEAEFPLVAVIFPTEAAFRAFRPVAPDVQAYYEIYSNRIFLYQRPSSDQNAPEVDALLRPHMTAHEGTHQILQNIGVHPRLSSWPLWLVEGLAEYCATPVSPRKGQPTWDGLGQINNLHMATLRELEDPISISMRGGDADAKSLFRTRGQPLVEAMIRRTELTPTEYALAWAMTHYLAMKRSEDFTRFLRIMAACPPLEPKSADEQVALFREAFGGDLAKLDKTIHTYLTRLTKQRGYDPMPYYAVLFQQSLPNGSLRRAAMVSQSPQLIQQWIDELSNPLAAPPSWHADPYPNRARATLAIQEWIRNQ